MNAVIVPSAALLFIVILWRTRSTQKTKKLSIKHNEKLLPPIRSPKNIIIAFDLHGVLFRHDYKKMVRFFWQSPHKWELIRTTLNPALWLDILKLSRTSTVPEAFIMQLAKQHSTIRKLLPTIIHIMNAQMPHKKTVELLHALKQRGYQLHILSNIGETIYQDMKQQFPKILSLFDNVVVTCAANGYISKPNPRMYYAYLATVDEHMKPLFIDNRIRNVKSAIKCGIASIHYDTFESAIKALKKLIPF